MADNQMNPRPAWWRSLGSALRLALAAFVLALALEVVVRVGLGLSWLPAVAPEGWLPDTQPVWRLLLWRHVETTLGLLLALWPVALLLATLSPRRGWLIALAGTALFIAAHPLVHVHLPRWGGLSAPGRFNLLADLLKQSLTLPLLSLAAHALWRRVAPSRTQGLAWSGLAALLASSAGAWFFVAEMGPDDYPMYLTPWALIARNPGALTALLAPLGAGLVLALGLPAGQRRLERLLPPLLLASGVVVFLLEAAKPAILARIHAAPPAPGMWNPAIVHGGGWFWLGAVGILALAAVLPAGKSNPHASSPQ